MTSPRIVRAIDVCEECGESYLMSGHLGTCSQSMMHTGPGLLWRREWAHRLLGPNGETSEWQASAGDPVLDLACFAALVSRRTDEMLAHVDTGYGPRRWLAGWRKRDLRTMVAELHNEARVVADRQLPIYSRESS